MRTKEIYARLQKCPTGNMKRAMRGSHYKKVGPRTLGAAQIGTNQAANEGDLDLPPPRAARVACAQERNPYKRPALTAARENRELL